MAPARMIPATGLEARKQARSLQWDAPTCGIAAGFLQANLIVLPSRVAHDFELLCIRNPVPCPLLAKSARPGDFQNLVSCIPGIPDSKIATGIDIRHDAPRYHVYKDGKLLRAAVPNIEDIWTDDHVAFLIGCSYSFENALAQAGLIPPHVLHGRNVPMYRSNIPLCPAGVFQGGTYVVSMRMYRTSEVEHVRDITRPYVTTHGEPIAWGWEAARAIGIQDVSKVDWGDAPVLPSGDVVEGHSAGDEYVPVFWGCGVTPQNAVAACKVPGVTAGHSPGYMIVLDVKEDDVIQNVA